MATVATNLNNWSAVKENVSPLACGGRAFLVVHHMLTEHLFFISWTPFTVCNCGPLQLAHLGCCFSLFGHPL